MNRRHFLGLGVVLLASGCTKRQSAFAPTYLTSAHGMAVVPSLPMLLVEGAPSSREVDRLATRLRSVLAPVEQERRAFLASLADGVSANVIDRKAYDVDIEKISAAIDKAAPYVRDVIRELHTHLDKKGRVVASESVERVLGTVDDEETWIYHEELRVMAAELELRPGRRWAAIHGANEDARRYRSPITNPSPLRKALDAFEDSDGEEAAWVVMKETEAETLRWARRMVQLVDTMLPDLDVAERQRLAEWLRSSRDLQ